MQNAYVCRSVVTVVFLYLGSLPRDASKHAIHRGESLF